jgi:signal recognition particle subunit SRP54
MKRWKHAIDSMTLQEIENPELIKDTRIARIAKGAGVSSADVRDLISQYNMIRGMIPAASRLGKEPESISLGSINRQNIGNLGLSQKQLRKLAKRMKGFKF